MRFLSRGRKGEDNEYARLLKVIRENYPEHLAEFIFAMNTGLRLSSQYRATYEMIDWARNVLDLPRMISKNGEPVHVPLNSDVLAAIRSLPSWRKGPIFRNQRHPEKPVLSNDHSLVQARAEGGRYQRF